jgi:hypothetical protein
MVAPRAFVRSRSRQMFSLPRFSLKFQRIVQYEQEANFLSRLHAGKLSIIPW